MAVANLGYEAGTLLPTVKKLLRMGDTGSTPVSVGFQLSGLWCPTCLRVGR